MLVPEWSTQKECLSQFTGPPNVDRKLFFLKKGEEVNTSFAFSSLSSCKKWLEHNSEYVDWSAMWTFKPYGAPPISVVDKNGSSPKSPPNRV